MSFNIRWPEFSEQFHQDAKSMLDGALNKGAKPKVIADDIHVEELGMGTIAPELDILEIGDLSMDRFRGIFRLTYAGDAHLVLSTKVQANPLSAASRPASASASGSSSSSSSASGRPGTPGEAVSSPPTSPFGYGQQQHDYEYDFTPTSSPLTSSLFSGAGTSKLASEAAAAAASSAGSGADAAARARGAGGGVGVAGPTRRGILFAATPLIVPMKLQLSHLRLRAIIVLIVSKAKGITLVFKNDPLESVTVSSTFDSVGVIAKYLQQEIEGQLREMFREDLPTIIHKLSQKWLSEGMGKSQNGGVGGSPSPAAAETRRKSAESATSAAPSAKQKKGPGSVSSRAASKKVSQAATGPGRSSSLYNAPLDKAAASGSNRSLLAERRNTSGPSGLPLAGGASAPGGMPRKRHSKAMSASGASAVVNTTAIRTKQAMDGSERPPLKRSSASQNAALSKSGSMSNVNGLRRANGSTAPIRPSPLNSRSNSIFSTIGTPGIVTSSSNSPSGGTPGGEEGSESAEEEDGAKPNTATWHLHGFSDPLDLIQKYDSTYGFRNEDPLTPTLRAGAPMGFSALGNLVESKKPALGLKELIADLPPAAPASQADEEAEDEEVQPDGIDGDAESVDPEDSDFGGEEEEALDFYFPNVGSGEEEEGEEEEDSDLQEETEEDEVEQSEGDDDDDVEDVQEEEEPGDFSKFGYPPPMAAFSDTGLADESLAAAFGTSPKQSSGSGSKKRTGSSTRASSSTQLTQPVEYETIPAVGGGYITRPRVFHHASYARAPDGAPEDYAASSYASSSRMGDETIRGSTFTSKAGSSRAETVVGGSLTASPQLAGGRRRQLSGLGTPLPIPSSAERWATWDDEEEDLAEIARSRQRREPSGASDRSQESGSLDSLPPEPVDTTSYEFRSREYRERYGLPAKQHWDIKRDASRDISRNTSYLGLVPEAGIGMLPSTSMTLDATNHLGELVHSNKTLSPFTRTMEGVAVRSAPMTPGFYGSFSGMTPDSAGSAGALPDSEEPAVNPLLLDSRLQAVQAGLARPLQTPLESTPPTSQRALRPQQVYAQSTGSTPGGAKGRRRRVFKLGGSKETPPQPGDAQTPVAGSSSMPTSTPSSRPRSTASSSRSASRAAGYTPVESLLSPHNANTNRRPSRKAPAALTGRSNAARWESIQE